MNTWTHIMVRWDLRFSSCCRKSTRPPSRGAFCRKTVVSNCLSPLERVSELIYFYLFPVVRSRPTYLKDTGDTIRKVEKIQLPNDIILASFDVVSMFTSVPQDEAFRTTLETLANLDPFDYNPAIPDEEYILLNSSMNIFSKYQVSPWARSLQVASAT